MERAPKEDRAIGKPEYLAITGCIAIVVFLVVRSIVVGNDNSPETGAVKETAPVPIEKPNPPEPEPDPQAEFPVFVVENDNHVIVCPDVGTLEHIYYAVMTATEESGMLLHSIMQLYECGFISATARVYETRQNPDTISIEGYEPFPAIYVRVTDSDGNLAAVGWVVRDVLINNSTIGGKL